MSRRTRLLPAGRDLHESLSPRASARVVFAAIAAHFFPILVNISAAFVGENLNKVELFDILAQWLDKALLEFSGRLTRR